MNHYELLNVPLNATTDEIKQHYRIYAKIHHPDKGGDPEKFKEIYTAYETLMDPIKRHQYDIELSGNNYTFTQDDYELIYKYYNSFINSIEVRLMMNLFYNIPSKTRSTINLSKLFKKKISSTILIKTDTIKYIDATLLYDNITLHLKRSLNDVFNKICKQIIVKTKKQYYHLFITDSDYNIFIYNHKNSTIKIELMTLSNHNFYKKGYDLCYIKKIDLYEYYYGAKFAIRLPNKFNICCNVNHLSKKKKSLIDTFGSYNPKLKKRGNLQIIYKIVPTDIDPSNKELFKQLFHKKEIFIDPSYPIYNL